jgi:cold shock CspA family protein
MINKLHIGVVKFYNMALGYGFITVKHDDGTCIDYFSHHTGLDEHIRAKDVVQFELIETNKGVVAVHVKRIN